MDRLQLLLHQIRQNHEQIMAVSPYRDIGTQPAPPADLRQIVRAEERIGHDLPPSYRKFLRLHNGWPRFFEGASLLGTCDLGRRLYPDLLRAPLEAAPPRHGCLREVQPELRLIPFGVDAQQTTLFAFDVSNANEQDEYPVVAWVNELGLRATSFPDFLEAVLEFSQAETAATISVESPAAALVG